MGENEQGGMLRNIVVIGLVAIIAAVVIFSVIGLKSSLRKNTVIGQSMGQNVLTDTNYKFNPLSGSEKLSYNSSTGVYDLILSVKSNYSGDQGMYYGAGGCTSPKDYDAFLPGDKYTLSADMRTDDVDLIKQVDYSVYFESSKIGGMYLHPNMSSQWQHYETNGIRLNTWGAPMFWFKNLSGQPVHIQLKNIQLLRVG